MLRYNIFYSIIVAISDNFIKDGGSGVPASFIENSIVMARYLQIENLTLDINNVIMPT